MDSIAGYATTGRRLKGPASDIVELTGDRGQMLSAVVFHPEFRTHRGINEALDVVARFLEDPMVPDLVEMVGRDQELGAFVYPTGQVWAVADVIRILADLGETAGVRAGLELMHRAGTVLAEAADFGASENVYSHGGLTPWRLVMRQDGRVLVVGHALPQVEILMFHEDHTVLPPSDSFRYCPPERIHGEEEDLTSDLFSLCLIAFEFMTGKPVYDGLVNDIRQKAARGEASQVLFRARESLPAQVRDILGNSMRLERHDRFEDGNQFLDAVARALSSGDAHGPSLADVMRKVSSQMQRRGVVPDSASTVMGTPDEIRAMLEDEDESAGAAEPMRETFQPPSRARQPRRGRAGAVERQPAAQPRPPESAAPEAQPAGRWSNTVRRSGARRRVRRAQPTPDVQEALSATPSLIETPPASTEEGGGARWGRVSGARRGVRRRGGDSAAPAAEAPTPDEPVDVQKVLRSSRVRRPRRARAPTPNHPVAAPDPPPVEPASEQLASPSDDGSSGASTADLLARIRQSATRSRRGSVDRPSAASDIIRELVQSSGKSAPSSAQDAPAVPMAPQADPTPEPPAESGRARRVRRVRRRGAPPPTDTPAVEAVPLAPPTPVATPPSPPPNGTTLEAPASAPVEATPKPPADQPVAPATTVGTSAASSEAPATPVTEKVLLADAQQAGSRADFAREPAPIAGGARSGGAAAFVVRRGPTGRGTRMRLPKEATVAEAIAWAVPTLVPVRTDLTGRLTGWYRIWVDGAPVPPDRRLKELDADKALVLHTVPNTTRLVELVVEGSTPARFLAPVGVAVPIVSLIDHITAWLGLPQAVYTLVGPSGPLGPHSILADLPTKDDPVSLVVRRQDPEESK